jgi:hypothetical protein
MHFPRKIGIPGASLLLIIISIYAVRHPLSIEPCSTVLNTFTFDFRHLIGLTFVTRPWPIHTDLALHRYQLTMSTWLLSGPNTALVLLFTTNTTRQTHLFSSLRSQFGSDRVHLTTELKVDSNGIPFSYELFSIGLQLSRTKYVCFIDSNVAVDQSWYDTVIGTFEAHPSAAPHVTGQRIEVKLADSALIRHSIDHSTFWPDVKRLFRAGNVSCFDEAGSSYFVWSVEAPAMAIADFPWYKFGGKFWDMWVNGWMDLQGRVISLRRKVPVYYVDPGDVENDRPTGMTVWNAKIARSKGAKTCPKHKELLSHYEVPGLQEGAPKIQTLIEIPECIGEEKLPVVQL